MASKRIAHWWILTFAFTLLPLAVLAATAVDPSTLLGKPCIVVSGTTHHSSRTTEVKDPTALEGTCIGMIAERNGTWDNQWNFRLKGIAFGVPYDIYVILKVRKTGEEGNAIGFGLYDSAGKLGIKEVAVPAREVKNMTWQAWKIGTFTCSQGFRGYPYGGIVTNNGANVPEAWFDKFIGVPAVNAQTEPLIKAFNERVKAHEIALAALKEELRTHPVLQPKRLLERFAFGVYFAYEQFYQSAGLFGEKWQDRFERSCEDFVRCYMDSVPMVNCPWSSYPKMDDLVRIAEETGVDIMPGAGSVPAGEGFAQDQEKILVPLVKRYADRPSLLTWYLWDEPDRTKFRAIMNARLICDSISPDKSATLIPCTRETVELYGPYLPVFMPDYYPVRYNNRNPWAIADWVRFSREKTGRPVWMMHQNYGNLKGKGNAACPTVGEFKLMSYLAVAEGASGLMPYHYYNKSIWMVERYATRGVLEQRNFTNAFEVHDKLWPVHKEIGRRMTAVGPLLLGAKYLGSEGLSITAPEITIAKEQKAQALLARVLEQPTGERYIVIVNNDPNNETRGEVKVKNLKSGLFELFELKPAKAPNGNISLTLPPGECRIYLAGSGDQFKKVKGLILRNRCRRERLIAKLEIRAAKKMNVELGRAIRRLAEAEAKENAGELDTALTLYLDSAQAAVAAVDADRDLAAAKKNLLDAQTILGKLDDRFEESKLLFVTESRLKARKLFFDTGKEYFRLLNLLRSGDRKIVAETEAIAKRAATLDEEIFGKAP